jgi:hypothetical protein
MVNPEFIDPALLCTRDNPTVGEDPTGQQQQDSAPRLATAAAPTPKITRRCDRCSLGHRNWYVHDSYCILNSRLKRQSSFQPPIHRICPFWNVGTYGPQTYSTRRPLTLTLICSDQAKPRCSRCQKAGVPCTWNRPMTRHRRERFRIHNDDGTDGIDGVDRNPSPPNKNKKPSDENKDAG